MNFYFDQDYYTKSVIDVTPRIVPPKLYAWFDKSQLQTYNHKYGVFRTVKWEAFVNQVPTTFAPSFNTVATITFNAVKAEINYLHVQYKFEHLKAQNVSDYVTDRYKGDVDNGRLPFPMAYELACNQINKIITNFILTGIVTVKKGDANKKILLSNMYGLKTLPNQATETVASGDRDKMDKIMEAIQKAIAKLELGDNFDSKMMVIIDQRIAMKLHEPYTIGAQNNVVFGKTWRDKLIDLVKGMNDNNEVIIHTSNLIQDTILLFPQNPEVLRLHESKWMLPYLNSHRDEDSSDTAYSYIDFVLGGLFATEKTICNITIST